MNKQASWHVLRRVVGDLLLAIAGFALRGPHGRDWHIESLMRVPPDAAVGRGFVITLHPERIADECHRLPIFYRLTMPLIAGDGLCLNATWASPLLADSTPLPVRLIIDRKASRQPVVEVRVGKAEFNRMVLGEQGQGRAEASGKAAVLGYFQYDYHYRIDSLQFSSEPDTDKQIRGAVVMKQRSLRLLATGCVRARVGDGALSARTTCTVKSLLAVCHLSLEYRSEGLCLQYRVDVQKLKVSARNVAPWLERKLGRKLRSVLQEAINRRAEQWQQRRHLLPAWLPSDTELKLILLG